MGADLIAIGLIIDKDKKPDWDAAEKYLRSFSDDVFKKQFEDIFVEMGQEHLLDDIDDARLLLLACLEDTKNAYEHQARNTVTFRVRDAYLWVLGETSWGDVDPTYDSVCVFIDSGAAKIAGFET